MTAVIDHHIPTLDPASIDLATRREFLALLAAAGLLTGCAGDDEPPGAPAAPGYPVTVRHDLGTTEFDVPPQRVVSLDARGMTDPLVALGVIPVGAVDLDPQILELLDGRVADVPDVGSNSEPNIEAIAALRPDLVVGYAFTFDEAADQLTTTGPAIAFSDSVKWRETLDTLARVLGRGAQRDEWLARIEAGVAAVRRVADGQSVAVITDNQDGTFFLSDERYDTSALLVDGGMQVRTVTEPDDAGTGNGVVVVSAERLGELAAADHLVVVTYEPDPARRVNTFEANPLWARLPAVQAGNAHVIDGSTWNNFGPHALVDMLAEAARLFAR